MNGCLFRIKKPKNADAGLWAYWVESTAPLNVDDSEAMPPETLSLTEMPPDQAIAEIAEHLNSCKAPQLVISVHGFNNPFEVVEKHFGAAYKYLVGDQAIKDNPGLVCIGYRWPSEAMGSPSRSLFSAAPHSLLWTLGIAVGFLVAGLSLSTSTSQKVLGRNIHGLLYFLGSVFAAVPFTTFLERTTAYFRDGYRATNYGVPDLLEMLRHLDKATHEDWTSSSARAEGVRIKLSFIGHSMGACVVTNLVRILTNVFDPATMTTDLADSASPRATPPAARLNDDASDPEVMRRIGNVYALERLVLVSPDIPAENLLQGRANFLQSSLHRFREAYLFSNEGDEALHLISTVANYFVFPTQNRQNGYRLGNVDVTTPSPPSYGIVNLNRLRAGLPDEAHHILDCLRVGRLTLAELSAKVTTDTSPSSDAAFPLMPASTLPAQFTYFDCTDYIDDVPGKGMQAIMTFAKRKTRMTDWDHFSLLCSYLFKQTPDVHSGYFYHPFSQCLIYRLACLGLRDTLASPPPVSPFQEGTFRASPSPPGLDGWSAVCATHQIQVLISPAHFHTLVDRSASAQDKVPFGERDLVNAWPALSKN